MICVDVFQPRCGWLISRYPFGTKQRSATVRKALRQLSAFRAAEAAHEIDDQTDQQHQSKSAAADGRAAKVKPAATEQEKQNHHK